jgi:chromosome segregation ATPase
MSEAIWQKQHEEIMKLEAQKNKLLQEIEPLTKEHLELSKSLNDLRKCIMVDQGDYKLIESERLNQIEELENKVVSLRIELEEKQDTVRNLSNKSNSLQNSIINDTKQIEKLKQIDNDLKEEIIKLSGEVEEIKLSLQEKTDEKRIQIRDLTREVGEKQVELESMRKEYEEKRFEILKEERLLSIKRSDLEIYEARMRKKYPNEAFVLK